MGTATNQCEAHGDQRRWLYLLVPFLSAMLLFQLELLISKYILPWFGGTPNVWSISMLFFQVVLFAGYAYSHGLATRLSASRQAWLHVAVLGASVLALAAQAVVWGHPLLASATFKPAASDLPSLRILGILTVCAGLPFFALSTTTSLLQAWFSRAFPDRSPYPLFAVSNAGSFFGLLSYPFLVEPLFGLHSQALLWAALFALFAVCCGVLALDSPRAVPGAGAPGTAALGARQDCASSSSPPTSWRRVLWLALPAIASIVLLATTNQLANDVPVIPFMWAIPLAIYLLTFILAFSHRLLYHRLPYVAAAVVLMGFVGYATCTPIVHGQAIIGRMAVYYLALFVCCMLCHGELSRLRPEPGRLTEYYLFISIGGAIGGLFVGLLAPQVFAELWELYIGYFLCGACVLVVAAGDRQSLLHRRRVRGPLRLACGAVVLLLAVGPLVLLGERAPRFSRFFAEPLARAVGLTKPGTTTTVLATRRNFYGVLRVQEADTAPPMRVLRHGQTVHGFQFTGGERQRREPTAYYTATSGIGRAILSHPAYGAAGPGRTGMRVGAIGMGVGTLAAYGRPGDCYRFYEINPAVTELAASPEACFTFIRDCQAKVELVMGDARISLEREPPQQFDILAVDAFSGDSVPVHLLTREALALYLRHVRADGIVAFHVSSRHLDLAPLVQKLADSMRLSSCRIDQKVKVDWIIPSHWVLVFRSPDTARRPAFAGASAARPDDTRYARIRVWTDDFSDLYHVLKRAAPERSDVAGQEQAGLEKLQSGKYREAVADFTDALKLAPDAGRLYLDRGIAYGKLGDQRRALADFTRAVALEPSSPQARKKRGIANTMLGRPEEAIADFSRAIELDPGDGDCYWNRGTAYAQTGRHREAVDDLTRLIGRNARDGGAYALRARSLAALGRLQEAADDARQARMLGEPVPDEFQVALDKALPSSNSPPAAPQQ